MNDEKNKGIKGGITASGIHNVLAGGRTAESYILARAMEMVGCKEYISTAAMRHGQLNQIECFQLLLENKGVVWHDTYTPIDSRCGASADALSQNSTWEIKCPYYIDTYLEQTANLPKKYYYQSQMQMMAERVNEGKIIFYLTSHNYDMYGNKIEYKYPLQDRHRIFDISPDEKCQYEILQGVDKYYPILIDWKSRLEEIGDSDPDKFFYDQLHGKVKYRKLKTSQNINRAIDFAIRVNNQFFYKVNEK